LGAVNLKSNAAGAWSDDLFLKSYADEELNYDCLK
jgi:hypothetical protein